MWERKIRFIVAGLVSLGLSACGERASEAVETSIEAQSNAEAPEDAGVDAGHDAGPPRPPARIFAKRFVTNVRERPDRDSFRVGYLRAGAVLMATTADPVRTDDPRCRDGWYELTTGGFVCNGRSVIAFHGRRLPAVRGAQPDRAAPMPYEYARTRRERTPMYRRLPTDEEAAEFEGYRIPGQEPPPEEAAEGGATAAAGDATATGEAAPSAAQASVDGASAAEGEEEAEPEPLTMEALRGDPNSALQRNLVRGFIVSLDREFRAGKHGRRYWRTINNGFVPYRAMSPVSSPDFRGTRIDDISRMPIGYILSRSTVFAFTKTDQGRARRGSGLDFHHRLHIVGEEEIGGTRYYVADDGRLYREQDVRRIEPRPRPNGVAAHEKWIEVNLAEQYVIAYEGDQPVYVTLTSTGRPHHRSDPTIDYNTPTGLFRVRAKHLASKMDGDADTATDGPYSIDDVPWVQYFELAYALHGAFWHNGFGFPRSHGCVNLSPVDGQWFFNWSDPQVPEGWHGAYPSESNPGTWIYVHGVTRGTRR